MRFRLRFTRGPAAEFSVADDLLQQSPETRLSRLRGAAHAAASRGARPADGGHPWQRRVTELTTVRSYPISPATPSTSPSTQSRNGACSSRMARIAEPARKDWLGEEVYWLVTDW